MDFFFKRRHTNGQQVHEKIDRWMNKIWCIYIYIMKHYSVTKKKNLVICDNRNGPWERESFMLSETSQTEKQKYHMCNLTYMCNSKRPKKEKKGNQPHR